VAAGTRRIVGGWFVLVLSLAAPLGGVARGQAPAGFELRLVDVDGTKKVLGQLRPSVYAPRISPDGKRVALETRDLKGADGFHLWTADLADLAGRRPFPLTGVANWAPLSSPDGQRLVFIISGDRPDQRPIPTLNFLGAGNWESLGVGSWELGVGLGNQTTVPRLITPPFGTTMMPLRM
jgi:hypothetical protein